MVYGTYAGADSLVNIYSANSMISVQDGGESLPSVSLYRLQHEVAVYYLPSRRPEGGGRR
jgi:hypothetical protein